MVDAIFGHPRLAEIYDALDEDRTDLDLYLTMADEVKARSVLDIGCGTGTLPPLSVDMVTMTGNVAQVFLTDEAWTETMLAARSALQPGGTLVFRATRSEVRGVESLDP